MASQVPSVNPGVIISNLGQIDGLTHIAFTTSSGNLAPVSGSNIVNGPVQLFGGALGNVTGGVAFLKLYDLAAATPLSGVAADAVFIIPGNVAGAGSNFTINGMPHNCGMQFFNGMQALVTLNGALADASTTSTGVSVTMWVR